MNLQIKRGDVYFATFGPVRGSEQGGTRPVVIIQNDIGNKFSPVVIVAPITSKAKSKLPTHTSLKDVVGFDKYSMVRSEQITTIDKTRLADYQFTLNEKVMKQIDDALRISLAL